VAAAFSRPRAGESLAEAGPHDSRAG